MSKGIAEYRAELTTELKRKPTDAELIAHLNLQAQLMEAEARLLKAESLSADDKREKARTLKLDAITEAIYDGHLAGVKSNVDMIKMTAPIQALSALSRLNTGYKF